MKSTIKNSQMCIMRNQLKPLLSRRDMIGYIAARNYRMLSDSLTEYDAFRDGLIAKYGEDVTDKNGIRRKCLKMESPNFITFCDELAPFNEMEHEIELMTAKYGDVIGSLSGEEILAIDWMLEE